VSQLANLAEATSYIQTKTPTRAHMFIFVFVAGQQKVYSTEQSQERFLYFTGL